MTFPILTTERLTLRRLSIDDRQEIFSLRSDTEINKYLDREPSKTSEDAIIFINKINENIEKGGTYYWAISLKETKELVGTICLFDFSIKKNIPYIYRKEFLFNNSKFIAKAVVSSDRETVLSLLPAEKKIFNIYKI